MSIRTILVDDEPLAIQGLQLRLEAVAKLVAEEARCMEAARQTFGNDVKTGFDILGTIDSEHPFGLLEQQGPTRGAGRRCGKAVV